MRDQSYVCALMLMATLAVPVSAQIDQQRAGLYFDEATAICERDDGRMWGTSLCGPMVIGDPRTRTIATSQPPPAAEQPRTIGFVNAPIEWGGVTWAAYSWDFLTPLEDRQSRGEFMLHELFHRVQPGLGLMTQAGENEHLDTVDGRIWLQLEWGALAEALRLAGDDRIDALRDAFAFRATRRASFPTATENERVEEIREGLAQYTATAVTAMSKDEAVASALKQLSAAEAQETFVGSFAYTSGVAYGLLLDEVSLGWRRRVQEDSDLGQMLLAALQITPAVDLAAASARYGGAELRSAEQARDERRRALVLELRERFVEGPVLLIPSGGSGTFDIRGATPIPGSGTVYFASYAMSGEWGNLDASNGVLVTEEGQRVVPGPVSIDGSTLTGHGWKVSVADGWVARRGPRDIDYQIVREAR